MKVIPIVLAALIGFASFVGAIEYRYGPREVVAANSTEIKRIKLERRIRRVQERMWDIQRQYGYDLSKYPSTYAREYQELKAELKILESRLNGL